MHGNLAIANGLIFAPSGTGGVAILDEATGMILRDLEPENAGPTYSGVVVAGGTVFWVSGGYLNAWGLT